MDEIPDRELQFDSCVLDVCSGDESDLCPHIDKLLEECIPVDPGRDWFIPDVCSK